MTLCRWMNDARRWLLRSTIETRNFTSMTLLRCALKLTRFAVLIGGKNER